MKITLKNLLFLVFIIHSHFVFAAEGGSGGISVNSISGIIPNKLMPICISENNVITPVEYGQSSSIKDNAITITDDDYKGIAILAKKIIVEEAGRVISVLFTSSDMVMIFSIKGAEYYCVQEYALDDNGKINECKRITIAVPGISFLLGMKFDEHKIKVRDQCLVYAAQVQPLM